MSFYNMGNHFSKKKFIKETLHHIHRNGHKIRDDNNNIIPDNEIKLTLDGMYNRQTIHYYKNLRCKPKMLELFVPNWWKF